MIAMTTLSLAGSARVMKEILLESTHYVNVASVLVKEEEKQPQENQKGNNHSSKERYPRDGTATSKTVLPGSLQEHRTTKTNATDDSSTKIDHSSVNNNNNNKTESVKSGSSTEPPPLATDRQKSAKTTVIEESNELEPGQETSRSSAEESSKNDAAAAITPNMDLHKNSSQHAIPNIVLFTHFANLLDVAPPQNPEWSPAKNLEIKVLSANVHHAAKMHPGATARFLTDDDCIESIKAVMGNDTELVRFFRKEKEGMYKADLCRGAALWQTGGLYFDVDLGVRINMFDLLKPETDFATVEVYKNSKLAGSFFQAFMAASPQHPVIHRYIELFLDFYKGKLKGVKRFVGVVLLKKAYDEIVLKDPSQVNRSEIWHEYKYVAGDMPGVPEPTWGTRMQCKMVVVTSLDQGNKTVPFYSRVADTRMCPSAEEIERQQQRDKQQLQKKRKERAARNEKKQKAREEAEAAAKASERKR